VKIGQTHPTQSLVALACQIGFLMFAPKKSMKKAQVNKGGNRTPVALAPTSNLWFRVGLVGGSETFTCSCG